MSIGASLFARVAAFIAIAAAGLGASAAEPAAPEPTSGLVAIPYLGVNSLQSGHGNASLRGGALLGGRIGESFSIDGELAIDHLNPGVRASANVLQGSLSPLYHAERFDHALVVGPKLGVWSVTGSASDGAQSVDISGGGWIVGVNLGLFFRVSKTTALGALVSYADVIPRDACQSAACLPKDQILGFTFAAMFFPPAAPPQSATSE